MSKLISFICLVIAFSIQSAYAMSLMQTEDFLNWMKYQDQTDKEIHLDNSCQIYGIHFADNATSAGYEVFVADLYVDGFRGHTVDATPFHGKWLLWEPQKDSQISKDSLPPGVKISIMNRSKLTLVGNYTTHTVILTKGKLIDNATLLKLNKSELSDWKIL